MPESGLMMHTLQVTALNIHNSRQSVPGPVLISRVPMQAGGMPAIVHKLLTSISSCAKHCVPQARSQQSSSGLLLSAVVLQATRSPPGTAAPSLS